MKVINANAQATNKVKRLLESGEWTIEKLEYQKASHRMGFYKYVQERNPNLLGKLQGEEQELFLDYALKMDPLLFIYLNVSQYTPTRTERYLKKKIKDSKEYQEGFLREGFDQKLVMEVGYETCEGEQLFYFDNSLKTQLFLVADVRVCFKFDDALKLMKKLDVDVKSIGYNIVHKNAIEWINTALREEIYAVVGKGQSSIYELNAKRAELEEKILKTLAKNVSSAGLTVEKVLLQKLTLSPSTARLLEEKSLETLVEHQRQALELEYEKAALENYEKKVSIHNNNPGYPVTLTEAEKDFALNRYIRKHEYECGAEKQVKVDRFGERKSGVDKELFKRPTIPTLNKKKIPVLPFILAAILVIVAFTQIANNLGVFFILFGVGLTFTGIGVYAVMRAQEKKRLSGISVEAEEEQEAYIEEMQELEKTQGEI